jgi:hypothetical protein
VDENAVVRLALHQHGLITLQQALVLGATTDTAQHQVARGRWTAIRRGVYVVGAAPATWEQRAMAACLAGGTDVLVSARSGARLWGLVERSGKVQILVAGDRRVRLAGVQVHRSVLLPDVDRDIVRGIPVTSLARTLVDASSGQDPEVVGRWIDQALRDHGLDIVEIECCLARLAGPGRRDVRAIRAALEQRPTGYDPGESDLEARVIRLLADAGLPPPVLQHPVRRSDGRVARIDISFPWAMVALEPEGFRFHRDRTAFDRDRIRSAELTLLGWDVYRLTSAMSDSYIAATAASALDVACEKRGLPSWRMRDANLVRSSPDQRGTDPNH